MKFIRKILSVLAICLMMHSVASIAATDNPDVYNEKKTSILVTPDHPQFTLELKANPTTGYSWFLRDYDSKLITPIKHSYQSPKTKLIGAPGIDVWTFRVNRAAFAVPQQTSIKMIYARPWQHEANGMQVVFNISTQSTGN